VEKAAKEAAVEVGDKQAGGQHCLLVMCMYPCNWHE